MTAQRVLFEASTVLNSVLIASMFCCGLWRSHRAIFILQIFLFLEAPLFMFASPALYAHLWPTFDKINIVLVLAYARYCFEDFFAVSIMLSLCIALKLCAWADIDPESMYVVNPYHFLRIAADLTATIVFILAIHRRKGVAYARARSAGRSYRTEPTTSAAPTA